MNKTEIKSYEEELNTNFHNDQMPKESSDCICLSVSLIDSVFEIGKKYFSRVFFGIM